ncbi:hypothetical protein [Pseudomonas sp. OV226]|uniref:hypothetical protein n=1 Tax=Pseudomonas sp. OV226 TaxID=2135588 RepID=UPI000D6D3FD9|nr:hypothetical protein [Pseudomonas sp. OV226]PWK28746.1 hypothetical protein C7534_1382 [Pseudomonas sp. OV226]
MTEIFLVFLALGFMATAAFVVVMNRLRRTKATYALYAVRDKLISLVANDSLSEDSAVFKHYYKRINMLLQYAPNIGIDQAYKSFLLLKNGNNTNFLEAFEKAREETENVLSSKELESEEISRVVQDYYSTHMEMVLSHSSATRFFYYALRHKILNMDALKKLPISLQKAMAMVNFSDDEIENIYERRNCMN